MYFRSHESTMDHGLVVSSFWALSRLWLRWKKYRRFLYNTIIVQCCCVGGSTLQLIAKCPLWKLVIILSQIFATDRYHDETFPAFRPGTGTGLDWNRQRYWCDNSNLRILRFDFTCAANLKRSGAATNENSNKVYKFELCFFLVSLAPSKIAAHKNTCTLGFSAIST